MCVFASIMCFLWFQTTTTLTTNDIVINKLTQILSYLRQGKREQKKLKKKEKGESFLLEGLLLFGCAVVVAVVEMLSCQ